MKGRPERHNLLIAVAALKIVASLAAYCLIFLRWLRQKPEGIPSSPKTTAPASDDLIHARTQFRENFLNPASHLELAEALYSHRLRVDAFYVLAEALRFFAPEDFHKTHERVVLRKSA